MPSSADEEDIPLPLVRRAVRPRAEVGAEDDLRATLGDRASPAVAGGVSGLVGGLVALGVVHGLEPASFSRPLIAVAAARDVTLSLVLVVAYVTSAAIGALVGAIFAAVTQHLRRWGPLLAWAIVFFVSLTMLSLAASSVYEPGARAELSGPILAASAAYAVAVSFSLPIRRRR